MRFGSVAEVKAKLSEYVGASQRQPVVILNHGKPAAIVIGVQGMDLEQIADMHDHELWALLDRRGRGKTLSVDEVEAKLKAPKVRRKK